MYIESSVGNSVKEIDYNNEYFAVLVHIFMTITNIARTIKYILFCTYAV